MKKKLIALLAGAAAIGGLSAQAQQTTGGILEDLSMSATLDFESEYVFRGTKLAGTSFQPSLEAGLPIAAGDLYVGAWDTQEIDGDTYDEVNFYAGYALPITDVFSIDVGGTYYWFPNDGFNPNREKELYIGASADVMLEPALYVYYNFTFEQLLFEGSIGHTFMLTDFAGLELGGYLGSADAQDANGDQAAGKPDNGYWYFGGSADLVYAINEVASASVGVRYSNLQDGPTDENFWWGASVSFGF